MFGFVPKGFEIILNKITFIAFICIHTSDSKILRTSFIKTLGSFYQYHTKIQVQNMSMKLFRCILPSILIFVIACKSNPDKKIIPGWSTELLGPLVKTKVTGEQILQLQDLSIFSFSTVYDFGYGYAGKPDSIPEIDLPAFTKTDSISSAFVSMKLEEGILYFKVFNSLDIDIKKGAVITILQQGVILLTDTLKSDVAAHNGYFISKKVSLAGKTLYPEVTIAVNNLGTHGTHGKSLEPGDKKFVTNFFIEQVSFESLTLKPGSYTITDTSSFNLNGRVIKTEAISGDIYTYVKNRFPFTIDMQFYFMDANFTRTDSLFSSNVVIPPSTPTDTEFVYKQPIIESKIPSIKQAAFLNSNVRFYSDQNVTISKQNYIDLQLVGDLKISVNE